MKRSFFGWLVPASAFLLVACGEKGKEGNAEAVARPFIVGMELSYPPFEMRSADNKPDGISVRMAEDLAARLGRPLEIRDVEWNGIIPALQSGKIDAIIASMTKTPEREKIIAFSDGYVTNGLCMLVARDSPFQSIADLKPGTHKIAVKLATTGHQWARAELPGMTLITLDDAAACALEVVQGKADAFIYDQISIYQYWKKYEDKTRPILKPIREETWAIGLRKEDIELHGQVNAFLEAYRAAGKFDELAARYMAEQKQAFETMGVPFIFH
ncbi:MAG: transporter substrate-binding domain-containing protein [Verrucomicrobiales bacterium]|jgi:polar amino acid transport system substrate-binding protein|nr:transporter substrate-binding domain-containing protein [Verrucomicrobiales bacterium]